MAAFKTNGSRKSLNFDLNLIPFIDVLSTCICFLLMTAVFIQLGTVNVKQSVGDGKALGKSNPPIVSIQLKDSGQVTISFKNVKGATSQTFSSAKQTIDWKQTLAFLSKSRRRYPQVDTAMILPSERSKYQDLIRFMDEVKKLEINNVGISPL